MHYSFFWFNYSPDSRTEIFSDFFLWFTGKFKILQFYSEIIWPLFLLPLFNFSFRADIEPSHHSDIWIESGCVRFGPIYIEGSQSGHSNADTSSHQSQHDFLCKHDKKTMRLWFLWPKSYVSNKVKCKEALGKCGCVGGCSFFGTNDNGIGFFKPSRLSFCEK